MYTPTFTTSASVAPNGPTEAATSRSDPSAAAASRASATLRRISDAASSAEIAPAGDDGAALEHFERSLTLLRDLDADETEGQVLANLGFVHERRGRRNEAEDCLNAALRKLPRESQAYRRVEEQLRRAS